MSKEFIELEFNTNELIYVKHLYEYFGAKYFLGVDVYHSGIMSRIFKYMLDLKIMSIDDVNYVRDFYNNLSKIVYEYDTEFKYFKSIMEQINRKVKEVKHE